MATSGPGVHVGIPLCHSTEDRARLHAWTIARWGEIHASRKWSVAYATDRPTRSMDEPPRTTDQFNHPRALNLAAGLGEPNDVLVLADADTFPEPDSLIQRINAARDGRWSVPGLYVNLSQQTTDRILRETSSFDDATEIAAAATDHVWQGGTSWAGVVVIRRDQFDAVGGYDDRYDGWWADDIAFAMSVETLVRPAVRLGAVYHLWHEARRSETYEREGFSTTWATTQRYLDAAGKPDEMRAILAER